MKPGLQNRAYDALNDFLKAHMDDVVEVEILPPSILPADAISMQDGLHLGVSKKILALAFLDARTRFFSAIEEYGEYSELASEASKVVLLHDPEYLTAANFRKRKLLHLQATLLSRVEESYAAALKHELNFLNSILTSPLHRQSKSPTLWYHRTWLLPHLIRSHDQSQGSLSNLVQAELNAVFKSGERHPKNYYAWQYARRLFSSLTITTDFQTYTVLGVTQVQTWCLKHPSDISGWSLLAWLLERVEHVDFRARVVQQVIEYATTVNLKNESVLVFVRLVLANGKLSESHDSAVSFFQQFGGKSTIPNELSFP